MGNPNTISMQTLLLIQQMRADMQHASPDRRDHIRADIQAVASEAVTLITGEAREWLIMRLRWSCRDVVDIRPMADALRCAPEQIEAITQLRQVA